MIYIVYFTILIIILFLLLINLLLLIYDWMQTAGNYTQKLKKARDWSILYLNDYSKIPNFNNRFPAVMFDIDDTLVNKRGDPLIDIIKIYHFAKGMGYKIIVITARSNDYKTHTARELDSIGVEPDFLFLRKHDDDYDTFKEKYKKHVRDYFGIDIVLSLGDQWVDVNGKVSGLGIKLPSIQDDNMYIIKRKITSS